MKSERKRRVVVFIGKWENGKMGKWENDSEFLIPNFK